MGDEKKIIVNCSVWFNLLDSVYVTCMMASSMQALHKYLSPTHTQEI